MSHAAATSTRWPCCWRWSATSPVSATALLSAIRRSGGRRSAHLIDTENDWRPTLSELLLGPAGTHLAAPAHRFCSAQQGALMLREGPRLPAVGCETGDWSHVDVYLTKTTDYRLLVFAGSAWEPQLAEWTTARGSTVVGVGGDVAGGARTNCGTPATPTTTSGCSPRCWSRTPRRAGVAGLTVLPRARVFAGNTPQSNPSLRTLAKVAGCSHFHDKAQWGACGKARVVLHACPSQQVRQKGSQVSKSLDEGPFFHGTIADLSAGEFLTAGHRSNYRPEIVMNHIYFTALVDGAGLAAEIAAELAEGEALPRVYEVEPTGEFENDPNVTDKKFPGNPTRSYRSTAPLRILREITEWTRLTPEQLQTWRERLSALLSSEAGEIIN